jgi:hypothetical protein
MAIYKMKWEGYRERNNDRLEKFTLAAMQGLLANSNFNHEIDTPEFISSLALKMAKAHIKAIDND